MNNSTLKNTTTNPLTSCVQSKPPDTNLRVTLFSLVIIASMIGNLIIIFVVYKNRRMHTVANYLICNMSIADLLITFLPMIWEVIQLSHFPDGTWPMGSFMCSFMFMCIYLSVACSILSLTAIAFDRFFAIIFPLKSIITKRVFPFLLIAIWLTSFAFASPTIFAQELFRIEGKIYCFEMWRAPFDATESPKHYTIILFVGLYAIPLVVIAGLYTSIGRKLWKRHQPGNRSTQSDNRALQQKKKVIKMLTTVTVVFAVCWFPVFLMQFLYFFDPVFLACPASFPQWFQFLAFFLQYLGSAVNPYIYLIYSNTYRLGAVNLLATIIPPLAQRFRRRANTSLGASVTFALQHRSTKLAQVTPESVVRHRRQTLQVSEGKL